MPDDWIIDSPLDMHLHLRQGEMLKAIAPCTTRLFAGAVIMPNTVPPIDNLERLQSYRAEIHAATGPDVFQPYMTLFFRNYREDELEQARPHIIGIKLYPEGITTNSSGGVQHIKDCYSTLQIMQELHIPLLVHGETHGFVMDREREFLDTYEMLATDFPGLTIIMEHITTAEAVDLLDRHEHLHATVTLHHLLLTLDDMAGGLLDPHLFCKPLLKKPSDREALQQAVLSGHPKIMFGSDSAPHPVNQKECCGCAAGVFTAPVCLAMLAGFFDDNRCRSRMKGFVSGHARDIYRIMPPAKKVRLEKKPWQVPATIGPVRPFRAGEQLAWSAVVV